MKYKQILKNLISKHTSPDLKKNLEFIAFTKEVESSYSKLNEKIDLLNIENKLLKETQNQNQIILNNTLKSYIAFDQFGLITFWNKKAEQVFGWKKEEVIGKLVYAIILPVQFIDKSFEIIESYKKTADEKFMNRKIEITAINRMKQEFKVEMYLTPVIQNGNVFFYSYLEDISERKKIETNLKAQEQKYRNIISNINIGLLEIDNDGLIQFANEKFSEISGYSNKELLGKSPTNLFTDSHETNIIESKKEMRSIGVSDIYQIRIKNKNQETRWWTISGAPNYDDKGNLIGSVGLHLDVTDQKLMEIELKKEKIKAEKSAEAKEAFLISMSHEIRTPLNAITGFLRELSREELNENQKLYVQNSSKASEHLLSIINNVLDLSKIEANEMVLENNNFNFQTKINSVISVLQHQAIEKNIKLSAYIGPEIYSSFKGDALRIGQILFNITGNSLKFTQDGEVLIKCQMINNFSDSQDIRISISDTGIGMNADFIENIFTKFSQENYTVARKFGGTGLGMSITNELIKMMNARILIHSEKNIGTTIHLDFNFKKGKKDILINPEKSKLSLENIAVLLVEDNNINRLIAKKSLNHYNCVVTEASNGFEAIEILKLEKFDIILMDIIMPEIDGIETTKIIREDLKLETTIIAFTANAFKSEIDKFIEIGMNDYIIKPYDESILIDTIAKHTIYSRFN